ncbi:conserved membrane hypothetical protein [Candidatus Sulfopaludibacter sp. SbA6]|nr:conserved membrane hypothetical protein [Candidatus Sulfopaludibacter sp. SbA6]
MPTLGIQPLLGRNITASEDQPHVARVAMISHGLWQSRFAGDPHITGKALPLDGQMATIVGVLPPQFELPTLARADVLVPLALDRAEQRTRRKAMLLSTVGRLKPGVTPEQAAALQPLFQRALELGVSPEFWKEIKLRVRPLRDRQVQEARLASWILFGAVLAVLAIACANVASLLLARAVARQREYAVRVALGAGRGRLASQALMESMLIGLAGGGAGCVLAGLLLRLFVTIAPEGIPRLNQAALDVRVLLFTLAASVGSGVLLGLALVLRNPQAETLGRWRTLGGRHPLFRQTLVAAQISLSLILVAGAGLLLRSLWNIENQPLGMHSEGVVTAAVNLSQNAYSNPARRLAFFEDLEARMRRIPGVREAALANWAPPEGKLEAQMLYALLNVAGRPGLDEGTGGMVMWRSVTPRYFAALSIPILRGRGFQEEDRDPNRNVMILSDSLARRLFPGEDPVGKQILPGKGAWRTVVGVAGNVKNNGLIERDAPEFYEVRKHSPQEMWRRATAIVRSEIDARQVAGWVRAEVAAIDPGLPVEIGMLDQQVSKLAARPRFDAVLLGIFAALGVALAGIGLYGLMSFMVAQRTQEIGVRMALGATPGGIVRLVLRDVAAWTAVGAAVGTAGALFVTRLLESMLFGVSSRDPRTLAAAVSVLFVAALAAAWIPARHAARVDPVEALRGE